MANLCMAHASTHGARKPPGPKGHWTKLLGQALYLMPKYWGKQIFAYGRFPEVGQKQKAEREKKIARRTIGVKNCYF